MVSRFSAENRALEDILFLLGTENVAQKLVEIFTSEDQLIRMNALRNLIKIGEVTGPVLAKLLSERKNFSRKGNSHLLADDSWYKIRNALFILSNLVNKDSVNVILKLKDDPDPRVRQEVIKALEKQNPEEILGYLLNFLEDPEPEIRKTTIGILGVLQNPKAVEPLIKAFSLKKEDRLEILKSLTRIKGEKALGFMLDIVTGKEKEKWRVSSKSGEDIKIEALKGLAKKLTPQMANVLARYLEESKKGLKSWFGKDQLAQEIEKVLSRYKSKALLPA